MNFQKEKNLKYGAMIIGNQKFQNGGLKIQMNLKKQFLEVLESNGYSITGIISIIYRGEKQIINKIGKYPYKSLLTINDIKQYKL